VKLPAPAYRQALNLAWYRAGRHRAGPFDRALGPEHVEGLPGEKVSFILCPRPRRSRFGGTGPGHVPVERRVRGICMGETEG